jgi:hypothetical protein
MALAISAAVGLGVAAVGGSTLLAVGAGLATAGIMSASQKSAKLPTPAEPIAPPESQAAKLPDAQSTVKSMGGSGQAGGAPGVAQTFLTGPGGIDQGSLLLGKTTLLGG